MSDEIYLGEQVIDKVTGLKGTVVAKCIYLNGCVQFLVQPKVMEHRIVEGYWIDEAQLELVNPPVPKAPIPKLYANLEEKRKFKHGGVRLHPKSH